MENHVSGCYFIIYISLFSFAHRKNSLDNLSNIFPHFDLKTLIPFMIDRWLMIGQANAENFYSSEQFAIYHGAIWLDLVDKLVKVSCSLKSICLTPDKKMNLHLIYRFFCDLLPYSVDLSLFQTLSGIFLVSLIGDWMSLC